MSALRIQVLRHPFLCTSPKLPISTIQTRNPMPHDIRSHRRHLREVLPHASLKRAIQIDQVKRNPRHCRVEREAANALLVPKCIQMDLIAVSAEREKRRYFVCEMLIESGTEGVDDGAEMRARECCFFSLEGAEVGFVCCNSALEGVWST